MFDGFFELIANLLNFFYSLVPNYALAIALLTLAVMLVTTPLTLKGTRSMIEMQRLQPEMRKLQVQYKDDRQKLNEEMMRFYKEHEINPLGGCFPLLIQAPVFSILYYVVQGLTNRSKFVGLQRALSDFGVADPQVTDGFRPKYLDQSTELYQALLGQDEMLSFGLDLSRSASTALSDGFFIALPYLAVVGVIALMSWYQQRQIMGRNPGQEVTQQQRMMMRIGPAMFLFFAFISPAAIAIYFLISTLWRVGQQSYITRSLYHGDDAIGVQAQKAMAEVRENRDKEGGGGLLAGLGAGRNTAKNNSGTTSTKSTATKTAAPKTAGKSGAKASPNGNSTTRSAQRAGAGGSAARKPHPRSRKKKKRK